MVELNCKTELDLEHIAELMVERTVKMEQGNELNLEQVRELIVE